MTKYKNYIPWILLAIVLFLFWSKSCSGDKTEDAIKVVIPEKKGEFEPVVNPLPETIREPFEIVRWKDKIVYTENPVNADLVNKFKEVLSENDSLKALALYSDAVAIREYNIPLDDSLITTNNYIKSQGEVLEFKQSYVIKPQSVNVEVPQVKFRMLGKIEVGNTTDLNDFNVKADLMFQNQKGNIFSVGYDVNKRIYVGYAYKLFDIKK